MWIDIYIYINVLGTVVYMHIQTASTCHSVDHLVSICGIMTANST